MTIYINIITYTACSQAHIIFCTCFACVIDICVLSIDYQYTFYQFRSVQIKTDQIKIRSRSQLSRGRPTDQINRSVCFDVCNNDVNEEMDFGVFDLTQKSFSSMGLSLKDFEPKDTHNQSNEKILLGKNDRRIHFDKNKSLMLKINNKKKCQIDFTKYVVMLLALYPNGKTFMGTGTIINIRENVFYILTCGHNVIEFDKNNNKFYPSNIWFVYGNKKYACDKCFIYPNYLNENDFIKKENDDIALLCYDMDDDDEHKEYHSIYTTCISTIESS